MNRAGATQSHAATVFRSREADRVAEHPQERSLGFDIHVISFLIDSQGKHHEALLRTLLCKAGQFIHALELNGMRPWQENQSVLHLSYACNQLVISGGDRHGCEPNAILNLTNAESFTEFVYQIRRERFSHVLFMPQYTDPYALRILQVLLDAIREYPSIGPCSWDERAFHPDHAGVIKPISELWDAPPFYVRYFFSLVRLLEMEPVRKAVLALAKPQQGISLALGERQEVAP